MLIKAGVDISRLTPPIRSRLACVDRVYLAIGEEMIITSTYEGNHGAGSLCYADLAIHFAYPLKMDSKFMNDFRGCFGPDYGIVPEQDYIYVEFDPK